MRIEIDQLLNFVREELATGDSYRNAPALHGNQLEAHIEETIQRFWEADPHYLHEVAEERYPLIRDTLGTQHGIVTAAVDDLYDALLVVHAFHDRFRFFDGGEPTMKAEFLDQNGVERIKRTISYLLHSQEHDYVTRMADCIFNPDYRLHDFGEACVQEALGWVNSENVPLCNSRTLKSLRWLGFDVKVA